MKRLILFLLITGTVLPQGVFQIKNVLTPEGSFNFVITGTGADTSDVYDVYPVMSCEFWGADTSGDDSVNATIAFQTCVETDSSFENRFSSWETVETWTLSSDSTLKKEFITDQPVPVDKKFRYIVTGLTGNSIKTPGIYRIKHKNWHSERIR